MESNEKKSNRVQQIIIASSFFLASLIDGLLHSALIPMIPAQAQTIGISKAVIPVLFSIIPCTVLIASPLLGHYCEYLGIGFMLYLGRIVTGGFSIAYGFSSSLWLSCLALFGLGMGGSLFWSSAYMFVSLYFSGQTALMIGILEVATGLGAAIGPPFAIFLADLLGFWFPFVVCCGFELFGAASLYLVMRSGPDVFSRGDSPGATSSDDTPSLEASSGASENDGSEESIGEGDEDFIDDDDDTIEDEPQVNPSHELDSASIESPRGNSKDKDSPSQASIPSFDIPESGSTLLPSPHSSYESVSDRVNSPNSPNSNNSNNSNNSDNSDKQMGEKQAKDQSQSFHRKMFAVMTNRDCLVALASPFLVQIAYSAIEPHLTRYLHSDLNLGNSMVGVVLMVAAIGYMAISPVVGRLADSVGPHLILIAGVALCGIGMLLLIPVPQAGDLDVGKGIFGLVLMSASQGMAFVPALPAMLGSVQTKPSVDETDLERGEGGLTVSSNAHEDEASSRCLQLGREEEAASFLGGIFNAVCQLGAALGPVFGQGLLFIVDMSGMEILLGCGLLLFVGLYMCTCRKAKPVAVPAASTLDLAQLPVKQEPQLQDSQDPDMLLLPQDEQFKSEHEVVSRPTPKLHPIGIPSRTQDCGEQMHEYGREFVLGKDVDPG